jgi:L,D-peptidoglycan transpeptidase YkuD (ErfK/YbiS/YcfS/YnhG family)
MASVKTGCGRRTAASSVAIVRGVGLAARRGWIEVGGRRMPCGLGRSGRRAMKREGDGATPLGRWSLRQVFYRRDRLLPPHSRLDLRALRPQDGWCDASDDRNYNRFISHPYSASAERLWRSDHLYDIVVVLGYNERPRIRGHGSAIFIHLARSGYAPTEGCISLSLRDIRIFLKHMRRGSQVFVGT